MTGTELISQERQRQIEKEGWTAEHDDRHSGNELALAASVYACPDLKRVYEHSVYFDCRLPAAWPFDAESWKPAPDFFDHSRIRELVKAGALIAAEIDRLQRLSKKGESQ